MRVLKTLASFFLILLGVSGFFYFLFGILWLSVFTIAFQNQVKDLITYADQPETYTRLCQSAPSSSEDSTPLAFQIRFLNEKEYAIEVICTVILDSPQRIAEGSLPLFITKEPGSGGYYYSFAQGEKITGIKVRAFNATRTITIATDRVAVSQDELPLTEKPKVSCGGFGYKCCLLRSEKGVGEGYSTGILDCPGQCFTTCESIPFIQLFVSEPLSNDDDEIVMGGVRQSVLFSYSATGNAKITDVFIDYGDGNSEHTAVQSGIFTHDYSCSDTCRYKVTIAATDEFGKTSIETEASTLYIVKK